MVRSSAATRSFEVVPVGVVCALAAVGRLPRLPAYLAIVGQRGFTLAEAASLTWAVSWYGPAFKAGEFGRSEGVCAWRDVFDHTHGREAREIVHIAGTKRAVLNMLRMMHLGAQHAGRTLFGHVAIENVEMSLALRKLGARQSRVVFEVT